MRHEDVVRDPEAWLRALQKAFKLETKPGFPVRVCCGKAVVCLCAASCSPAASNLRACLRPAVRLRQCSQPGLSALDRRLQPASLHCLLCCAP